MHFSLANKYFLKQQKRDVKHHAFRFMDIFTIYQNLFSNTFSTNAKRVHLDTMGFCQH